MAAISTGSWWNKTVEAIVVIVLVGIGWAILSWILRAGTRTGAAAIKTAAGHGSFSENMVNQFYTMGEFEIRLVESTLGQDGDGPEIKEIQGRGLLPVLQRTNAVFISSVFDITDDNIQPVLCHLEEFQESTTVSFQQLTNLGIVEPDQGLGEWIRIGGVIPDILQPPVGGIRKIRILFRLVDLDNMPDIELGFIEDPALSLWVGDAQFMYFFEGKGYKEESEEQDESRAISIKIGMAVAMADGSLDDREGELFREWIVKSISPFNDARRAKLKSVYNDAMRESYNMAVQGELSLTPLTERLNEIGERSYKYETVELCFDIMAADGVADVEELKVIRQIAEALELDFDEIERLRDQKIIGLDASITNRASIEEIIGIKSDWSKEEIRRGGKKSIPHESRLGYNCACLLYATDGPENCLIAGPISGTNVGA